MSLGERFGVGFSWVLGGGFLVGGGAGTGKGTGKSMRNLCRNYPLANYPLLQGVGPKSSACPPKLKETKYFSGISRDFAGISHQMCPK